MKYNHGVEVKAAKSLSGRDLAAFVAVSVSETFGNRLHRGILLYMGQEIVAFGKNLYAMPIQALWQTGDSQGVEIKTEPMSKQR